MPVELRCPKCISTLRFPHNLAIGNDLTHAQSAIPHFGLWCGNERYAMLYWTAISEACRSVAGIWNERINDPKIREGRAPAPDIGRLVAPLGVPDTIIQRNLRHANVTITAAYYVKRADDVRHAMEKLEKNVPQT